MSEDKLKKESEAYLKSFLDRLSKSPDTLKGFEKRLGEKYSAARDAANKMMGELENLRKNIRQAEERARVMELQMQSELGKAAGFLDSIVEVEMENLELSRTKATPRKKENIKEGKKDNGKDQPVVAA